MSSENSPNKKVLIIQTAFLGDAVLTLPLASALFEAGFQVSFLSRPSISDIFESSPAVSKVMIYDKRKTGRGESSFFKILSMLKKENFDYAFLPQRSFRSGLLAWLAGIKIRVGFKRGGARFFLNRKYSFNWDDHEVHRILSLFYAVGPVSSLVDFNLVPDEKLQEKYKKLLGPGRFIGLATESVWPTKRWPRENFESFAELLPEDFTPVYLGTNPSEKQLERGLSFEGKTNVKDLIALVSLMDFLISNDSGIIHIASALGIRVGAIFGPTVPALGFTPFGSRHVIIENKDLKCRPCSLHGPRTCPEKHFKCMLDISPEDVLKQVKKFFE